MSSLFYQTHQCAENAPWIILIHGLFGNSDNLAGLKRGLADKYNVLSLDLPDHGKSLRTEEFSFSKYAEHIVELLNELNIKNANIIGHSLGGKIAMQIALNYPQLIAALVVIDIAPVAYAPRHQAVLAGLNNIDLTKINSRKDAELILQQYVQEPSTRQFLLKSLYQQQNSWHWYFNLTLLNRDYAKLSQAIEAQTPYNGPTMFIKGELSDYIQSEHRAHILKLFPHSQLKILGASGHWLHAEKPALCVKLIDNFLTKA